MLWLLLAAAQLETPDTRPVRADAAWLVGTWLLSADHSDLDRAACNSGTTHRYKADGTTEFFEGNGRWRLSGDRLSETITEVFPEAGDAESRAAIGRWTSVRIERVGPGEGVAIDGRHRSRMLRCRAGDTR